MSKYVSDHLVIPTVPLVRKTVASRLDMLFKRGVSLFYYAKVHLVSSELGANVRCHCFRVCNYPEVRS